MGRALKSDETRDSVWQKKSAADRQAIYRLAVVRRREIQTRWDARQVAQAKVTRPSNVKPTRKPAKVVKSKSSRPPPWYGSYGLVVEVDTGLYCLSVCIFVQFLF